MQYFSLRAFALCVLLVSYTTSGYASEFDGSGIREDVLSDPFYKTLEDGLIRAFNCRNLATPRIMPNDTHSYDAFGQSVQVFLEMDRGIRDNIILKIYCHARVGIHFQFELRNAAKNDQFVGIGPTSFERGTVKYDMGLPIQLRNLPTRLDRNPENTIATHPFMVALLSALSVSANSACKISSSTSNRHRPEQITVDHMSGEEFHPISTSIECSDPRCRSCTNLTNIHGRYYPKKDWVVFEFIDTHQEVAD